LTGFMDVHSALAEPLPARWDEGLDLGAVFAGQGIDAASGGARMPALRAAAARALQAGRPLLAPAIATRLVAVEQSALDEIVLAGGRSIAGFAPARRLSGALHVLLAVCTVGQACDQRAAALMREDPATALAFDGLATAAVNALAGAVCESVRADAARSGQRVSVPLSPGQGEWDLLEGQRAIFALVTPARIGVTMSERGQMRPIKSVSFAIGIGPTVNDRAPGPCAGCSSQPGCHWARLPSSRR
jgi:hypothetical protein